MAASILLTRALRPVLCRHKSAGLFGNLRCLSTSELPLTGITVVALEQAVAAPLCTMRLADDGARVIKVERVGTGDFARQYDDYCNGGSTYFTWLNRGKESLALDLKQPQNLALLRRLVLSADVFVQNLAPGAVDRMGLGWQELAEVSPGLITLDISGYGDSGPMREYKAYDLLVCAEAGLCSVTGTPDGPGRAGISLADITAGLNGYGAVQRALFARERARAASVAAGKGACTAQGAALAVSLFDSLAEQMAVPYLQTRYTGRSPRRVGLKHPSIAPYGSFATADAGRQLLISVQNEREWRNLCVSVLADGDESDGDAIATDPRFASSTARVANRTELDALVADAFVVRGAEELADRLLAAGVAFGALNTVEDLVNHPQCRTVEVDTSNGPIAMPAPAVQDKRDAAVTAARGTAGSVPELGEHTERIREEFGA